MPVPEHDFSELSRQLYDAITAEDRDELTAPQGDEGVDDSLDAAGDIQMHDADALPMPDLPNPYLDQTPHHPKEQLDLFPAEMVPPMTGKRKWAFFIVLSTHMLAHALIDNMRLNSLPNRRARRSSTRSSSSSRHAYATSKHRDELPPEPANYRAAMKHPHAESWRKAMAKEFHKAIDTSTFSWVSKQEKEAILAIADNIYPDLPLKWVYKYKLDEHGMLISHKARLCARGDLQSTHLDTYAATLPASMLRLCCALVATFDLEAEQFDVVNAFLNADLPYTMFLRPPPGIDRPPDGYSLKLKKALYGLKESPLLWYNTLTDTLSSLGLKPLTDSECIYRDDKVMFFFYVDNLVIIYYRKNKEHTTYIKR